MYIFKATDLSVEEEEEMSRMLDRYAPDQRGVQFQE